MTDIPLPNLKGVKDGKPVARRILAWLVAHPDAHDQAKWNDSKGHPDEAEAAVSRGRMHCGTTCCIAGAIALADGWSWEQVYYDTGDDSSVATHAAKRLGLDYEEAYDLFHTMNEEASLRGLARVANGERPT